MTERGRAQRTAPLPYFFGRKAWVNEMKQKKSTVLAAWLLTVLLAGCTVPQADAGTESGAANVAETAAESGGTAEAQAGADGATGGVIGPVIEENLTFKGKDEYSDYAGAVEIDLSAPQAADGVSVSGSTVTISAAGTYVLTGTLADGQVVVAAGENDDVRLVLENASISSASTAPVYVKSADKVILSLPEGTESYVADAVTGTDGEDTLTGAIYAACDLSINGSGTLRIEAGANDAISTKDDLRITGGTLEITAADDGLVANDGILICGGTLRITAGGDGLDSNGTLTVSGGTILVSGPTDSANGIFDSGTSFTVNGGVLLGTGSAGMLETPGEDSAQNTLCAACSGSAGSAVEIRDADGSVLAAYTAPKAFSIVVCSAPEITQGETYTIFVDGAPAAQVECTGVVSGDVSGMGGFGGQPDMNGGAQNGGPGAEQAPGMRGGFSDR